MIVVLQILYGIYNGFSSSTCFESGFFSFYNIILTIPQLYFICVVEQDIESQYLLTIPECYHLIQQYGDLSQRKIVFWFLKSIFHSCLIFLCII